MNAFAADAAVTGQPFVSLATGDRCPRFGGRTAHHPGFAVDSMAGRYLVVCASATASDPAGRAAMAAILRNRALFDDAFASVFTLSVDPQDEATGRVQERLPGVRAMWDFDTVASRALGLLPVRDTPGLPRTARRFWLVIDPTLHVLAVLPFSAQDPEHAAVFSLLRRLPPPKQFGGQELPVPVLMLPNVFETELCRTLVEIYRQSGGAESGVMREGLGELDSGFKRRRDHTIEDPALIYQMHTRVRRRVLPEIERLFFMPITRIERNIVACYSAEDGGHFRPHRDNGQGVTEHRRFALSINLSADFEGGEVVFPEYSLRGYKAPMGWALIFPCAILHAVSQVTAGSRFAYLPFLYDEAGAAIREARLREAGAAA